MFILIQYLPLHACYMFRPIIRPSSDVLMQILKRKLEVLIINLKKKSYMISASS